MLPLGDLGRAHRMPWVTLGLVLVNLAVWLAYQVPRGIDASVETLGFHACAVDGSCRDTGLPWLIELWTAMFTHAGWAHIVGNLMFLVAFGSSVENLLGAPRYLALYLVSGVAAAALWGAMTLTFMPSQATAPAIGASGAISGVIGAYLVVLPFERIVVWVPPVLFLNIPAVALLGVWFVVQALEASFEATYPDVDAGVAFFAHVGGTVAGFAGAALLVKDTWPRRLRPHRVAPPAASA